MGECRSKVTLSGRDGSISSSPIGDGDCQDRPECSHPHHPPKCPSNCGHQDYVLSDGFNVHVESGKEVNHDFILSPNPYKDCGTLSGYVKDKCGKGIENALVKVFDSSHHPIAHVFTNQEGQFLICLAPGHYIIKAVR